MQLQNAIAVVFKRADDKSKSSLTITAKFSIRISALTSEQSYMENCGRQSYIRTASKMASIGTIRATSIQLRKGHTARQIRIQ